jgi:hypothetical protein
VCARYFALFVRQHQESGEVRLLVKVRQAEHKKKLLTENERVALAERISRLEELYSVVRKASVCLLLLFFF